MKNCILLFLFATCVGLSRGKEKNNDALKFVASRYQKAKPVIKDIESMLRAYVLVQLKVFESLHSQIASRTETLEIKHLLHKLNFTTDYYIKKLEQKFEKLDLQDDIIAEAKKIAPNLMLHDEDSSDSSDDDESTEDELQDAETRKLVATMLESIDNINTAVPGKPPK